MSTKRVWKQFEFLSEEEWDKVFNQIRSEVELGDFTAIYELLEHLPAKLLRAYIEE